LAAALQPRGALVALGVAGLADLLVDAREQRGVAVLADEELERGVEALAVEVRVQVVQTGRKTAAHLAVGAQMLAARERAAAVAQAEERVELLDELGRGGATAHRADTYGVAGGGLGRDLEDRERDVQPAADVDVAVGIAFTAHIAGRL